MTSALHPFWVVIPNFVDTEVFSPAATEQEKRRCREKFGIPPDAFVVGCAAAVKKNHKRIDYLIGEFASFVDQKESQRPTTNAQQPTSSYLLIAGARQKDTDELVRMAKERCGDRVKILTDVPREGMPDIYRCMDLFVLASLFEMMPISVLEALASGLPVIANDHPVLRWMVGIRSSEFGVQSSAHGPRTSDLGPLDSGGHGAGGAVIDMAKDGELAGYLAGLTSEWIGEHGGAARAHALAMFSKAAVIDQYIEYYEQVMAD